MRPYRYARFEFAMHNLDQTRGRSRSLDDRGSSGIVRTVIAWLYDNPRAGFAIFLVVHAIVWTAMPSALYPNLPLDIIEALTYGREWQLGYDKLPPMPWWIIEATRLVFNSDIAYYAVSQITVVGSFTLVWLTALPLVGPIGALVAVLIIDGIHYVNFSAAKFNHDVIQLPFWAFAGWAFHRALTRGRLVYWIALGIAFGVALWAKYFVVMLAIPMAIFVLADHRARGYLKTPGPYLAVLCALVFMSPHLVWLVDNDFLPYTYASQRAIKATRWFHYFYHPALFMLSQAFFMIPGLAIAAALVWPRTGPRTAHNARAFDRRIVDLLTFGPLLTLILASAITGRGLIAMWGYPLWMFFGLWAVLRSRKAIDIDRFGLAMVLWTISSICIAGAFVINYTLMPAFDQRYRAVFFPGETFAREVADRFRAETGTPLAYVISTMWLGGNVAHYATERPRVLIDGNPRRAPWIDLDDLHRKGAVVLWTDLDTKMVPPAFGPIAAEAEVQAPLTMRFQRGDSHRSFVVGWAILRSRP
ncbi:MAG: hypothetical protein GHHEDOFH_01294 [Pseudorhodoplanes sp.]|nr:hypothetical protein [Pseudorhodoplanes sp.]